MKKRYNYEMVYPMYVHGKGTYAVVIKDGKVSIPALSGEDSAKKS